MRWSIVVLMSGVLLLVSCRPAGKTVVAPEILTQYLQARNLYYGQDLDAALQTLLRCCEQRPDFAAASFLIGKIYYFKDEQLAAEKCWKRTLAVHPHHSETAKWLARLYLSQERSAEAENLVAAALADDSEDPELLILLGRIRRSQNDLVKALELFTRAEMFTEQLAEAPIQRAEIYRGYGLQEKAAAELERALALLGEQSPLSAALGSALQEIRKENAR